MLFLLSVLFQSVVCSPEHSFLPLVQLIPAGEFYLSFCLFVLRYNLSGPPFCAAFWMTSSRLVIPPSVFTFYTPVSRTVGLKSMCQSIFNLFTYLSPTMRLTPSLFHINPSHPIWNHVWLWQTFKEEITPFTTPSHALEHSVIVTCVSQQYLMEPHSLLTLFMSCQVDPLRDALPWVPSLAPQNPHWPLQKSRLDICWGFKNISLADSNETPFSDFGFGPMVSKSVIWSMNIPF